MPLPGAGAGQALPQLPQFIGSRVQVLAARSGSWSGRAGTWRSRCPRRCTPHGHCIVAAAARRRPALHIAGSVRRRSRTTGPPRTACPARLLPLAAQTDAPVAHDVMPILHGFGRLCRPDPRCTTRSCPSCRPGWCRSSRRRRRFCPGVLCRSGAPVVQVSVPVWQGLAGAQAPPALHTTQAPLLHTMLRAARRAVRDGYPTRRTRASRSRTTSRRSCTAFVGWQLEPAAHDTQMPALQTLSVPQRGAVGEVAAGVARRRSLGEQTVMPAWHGFAGTHAGPAVHATQHPRRAHHGSCRRRCRWRLIARLRGRRARPCCTRWCRVRQGLPVTLQSAPDGAVGARAVALHTGPCRRSCRRGRWCWCPCTTASPPVQVSVPVWQRLVGSHAAPAWQATHAPAWQTMPVPHAVPFGLLSVSVQTGAPVVQTMVPTRQGLLATSQAMPAWHAVAGAVVANHVGAALGAVGLQVGQLAARHRAFHAHERALVTGVGGDARAARHAGRAVGGDAAVAVVRRPAVAAAAAAAGARRRCRRRPPPPALPLTPVVLPPGPPSSLSRHRQPPQPATRAAPNEGDEQRERQHPARRRRQHDILLAS